METCLICLAAVESVMAHDHIRWHKVHGHHQLSCASRYFTGEGQPPNPCTCPMLTVWV